MYGSLKSGSSLENSMIDSLTETSSLLDSQRQMSHYPQDDVTDPEFRAAIKSTEQAILGGIYPIRIAKGSSGSYFAQDSSNVSRASKFDD